MGTPGSSPSQTWTLPVSLKMPMARPVQADRSGRADDQIRRVRRNVRQCRQPRLLLHRLHRRHRGQFAKNPASLTAAERISLLGDEWWMVRAGRHDIDLYLDLAAAMASDDTPVITETIARPAGNHRRHRGCDRAGTLPGLDPRASVRC